jgi:hypothetical protein
MKMKYFSARIQLTNQEKKALENAHKLLRQMGNICDDNHPTIDETENALDYLLAQFDENTLLVEV